MTWLWVALGSALGGVARYGVGLIVRTGSGFPWATLTVNLLGSLLIGALSGWLARCGTAGTSTVQFIRSFAVVGICGGFTTFSTFSNDAFRMLENGQGLWTLLYVSLSLVGGLAAVFFGYWISRC